MRRLSKSTGYRIEPDTENELVYIYCEVKSLWKYHIGISQIRKRRLYFTMHLKRDLPLDIDLVN
jgi:hypothetical protein